jgi:sterol-4alpha-carboxylate 3-dehydrogenase (decarboxylating)
MSRDLSSFVITGASGSLGVAIICEMLRSFPKARCTAIDLAPFPLDEIPKALATRIDAHIASILDPPSVLVPLFEGAALVIHAAALVDIAASEARGTRVNLGGTKNILRVAKEAGATSFIFASTMDTVISPEGIDGVDENVEYPEKLMYGRAYAGSKQDAERVVRAASTPTFTTSIVRFVGVYGPRDRHHIGNLLRVAQSSGCFFKIGLQPGPFQFTYVGNVAIGIVALARTQAERPDEVSGEIFHIGDHTPLQPFFDFLEPIMVALGQRVAPIRIPGLVALIAAYLIKFLILPLIRIVPFIPTPPSTHPLVLFTPTTVHATHMRQTYDWTKARLVLGFEPRISPEQAMSETIEWWTREMEKKKEK